MSFDHDKEVFPFPGKVKSSVWEYFGFYKDSGGSLDKSKAICKICRRPVNYTGNTTNLRAHVVHHHRGEEGVDEKSLSPKSMPSLSVGFSSPGGSSMFPPLASGMPLVGSKLKTFRELDTDGVLQKSDLVSSAITNFLITDLIPIETLDSEAFRNMLHVCGSFKMELPGSEEINGILLSNYICLKQKIAESLLKAESEYLKVELWRTVQSNYMTVSVQALVDQWKVKSYVLHTYDLGEKYTAKNISDQLGKTIQDWNLPEEIIILSDDNMELVEAVTSLSCVQITSLGVSINRAAVTCLEHPVVVAVLKHTRTIIELFTQESNIESIFLEKQKLMKLPKQKLMVNDWNSWLSSLEMLDIFNEQSAAIMATLNDPNFVRFSKKKMLTPKEQSLVQTIIGLLKPLKMALSLSHSMRCPMMSIILPVLKKLELALSSNDCDSQVMEEVKDKMLASLRKNYCSKESREHLLLSSLLDPRFKDLKFVDQSDQEIVYNLLKQSATEVENMLKQSKDAEVESPQDCCIKIEINDDHEFSSCSSEDATAVALLVDQLEQISRPVKRQRLSTPHYSHIQSDPVNDWLADVVQETVQSESQEDNVSNEISRYKSELQVLSTSSPLSWWCDRKKTYPILSQVAKKYASAPAIFSDRDGKKQELYERQRSSLTACNIEMMVFLNGNFCSTQ